MKQLISFLYGIVCMTCIAALFSFGMPSGAPPDPVKYYIRTATIAKVNQDLNVVYGYLQQSNLPQQEVKQLMQALQDAATVLNADVKDSTLNK